MKKYVVTLEMPEGFKIGECNKCRFARRTDQCKLIELVTDGSCKINCFCPIGVITFEHKHSSE